ncbi:hypothetical protein [Neobacillus rhizophilus]|uniref:Uncharacterized protein n=1 Tax=Neobacillus rhizophilus TaxID=2833579 RepID=A0A942U4T3_9BACI|nr:hypothetical protein [Neobacillus rhizophilus]MBS4212441.1 hypothetical protein [Neobacillus rhizophilus]
MQIPINENIADLTLLKAIDEEINDCHLRDLAVALGEEQIFSLLNSMVQDSNFIVGFAFNNITYELQKNDYTDLFLPDHKLSFKKPLNPFIRMKLIKALKRAFEVYEVKADSREVHITFYGNEGPFANSLNEVQYSTNKVLVPYIKDNLQRVGIKDYHVKLRIAKLY